MQLLYDYLTGNEFRQRVDAIREAFENLNSDLQKERSQALANFAKREKQIFKVMENTVALYGEVRGIAGGAVQTIPSLESVDDSQPLSSGRLSEREKSVRLSLASFNLQIDVLKFEE